MENRNVWQRFWSYFTGVDIIDLILYGGLGLVLLGFVIYSVVKSLLDASNHIGLLALSTLLLSSIYSLVRDLRKKHLSIPSKLLVSAWALCVGIVIIVELLEMVR